MTQRKIFTTLLFVFGWLISFAQPYPVSTNIALTSPTVPFLDEFTVATSNPMIATIILNDMNAISYDVKLRLTISGGGITIRTKPDYLPLPITLTYNTPIIKTGAELAQYFNPDNLEFQGISKQQYLRQGRLPEGFYSVCIEAFDYQRTDLLAVSNRACATAQMIVHDPPIITTLQGQNNETTPQNYQFSWQAMHVGAFPVEYELSIYEAIPNLAPNQIFTYTPPYAKVKTFTTTYLYSVFDPILQPDKEYYATVRATDISGLNIFKNDGLSKYETFILETPCTPFSSCDDGNECTYNDTYSASCDCMGIPLHDSEGTILSGPFDIPKPNITYPENGILCIAGGNTVVAWTPGHDYAHAIDYELTLTKIGVDPYSSKKYLNLQKEIQEKYNLILEEDKKEQVGLILKQKQKEHIYLITQGELTSICSNEYKDMNDSCEVAIKKAIDEFEKEQIESYNLFLKEQQIELLKFEKEKETKNLEYKEETKKELNALIEELKTEDTSSKIVFSKTVNELSYIITAEDVDLEFGTKYTIDIIASDNCNQSTFSNDGKSNPKEYIIKDCDAPVFEETSIIEIDFLEEKVLQEDIQDEEFPKITQNPVSGTIFLDTINADSTNYAVLATDTSIIVLPKLALYPPVVPAKDVADLVSQSPKPNTVQTKSTKLKQAFEDINVTVDKENKTATITWELKDPKGIKELVVYKGPNKDEFSMWKIIDPSLKSIKLDNLKKAEPIFLYIDLVYEEGDLSKSSDLIIVEFQ